jgi:diguanylate cyclase (GGDEF)-like protein
MDTHQIKKPSVCNILVVDDEEIICDVLEEALEPFYKVTTCTSGREALTLIEQNEFDVVVTDLKLPDISGIDILNFIKGKDEYAEVIIITGYASLDSATVAINQGVNSYMIKPLDITDFLIKVEKAVASRLFHLKSLNLMRNSEGISSDVKEHLFDLTSLYFFTRKLMLSLEISEIMRITLEEANQKMGSVLSVISVNLSGFMEVFAMPSSGEIEPREVRQVLLNMHQKVMPTIDKERFAEGEIPLVVYKGKQGETPGIKSIHPVSVPMMVTGRTIGSLTVFFDGPERNSSDQCQFLYVFSSMVSPVVEHGYTALQVRRQAKTDSLTGIANHRLFQETLDREIARATRKKGKFSLLLIDIDDFKSINDTYGHQVGDAVIIDLTKRISAMVRVCDLFARYGGEEFSLVLPDTDLSGAEILASRILTAISSRPFSSPQYRIGYTISIGLAVFDWEHGLKKDRLIEVADRALYTSKRNGKNRFTVGNISV